MDAVAGGSAPAGATIGTGGSAAAAAADNFDADTLRKWPSIVPGLGFAAPKGRDEVFVTPCNAGSAGEGAVENSCGPGRAGDAAAAAFRRKCDGSSSCMSLSLSGKLAGGAESSPKSVVNVARFLAVAEPATTETGGAAVLVFVKPCLLKFLLCEPAAVAAPGEVRSVRGCIVAEGAGADFGAEDAARMASFNETRGGVTSDEAAAAAVGELNSAAAAAEARGERSELAAAAAA